MPWWRNPRIWFVVLLVELSGVLLFFLVARGHKSIPQHPSSALTSVDTSTPSDTLASHEMGMPNTLSVGGGKLRASQSGSHSFPIDVSAACAVLIMYSHGELDLEVKSPSGRVLRTRKRADGHSERVEGIFGLMPGWTDGLSIERPERGEWTVKVTAQSVPDSVPEVSYWVTLIQDTEGQGPVLRSLIIDRTYHHGEPLELRASLLEEGRPVEGAQVEANVGPVDGENARLTLNDDGRSPDALARDGVFSARVPVLQNPGYYMVAFSASRSGIEGKPDFKRVVGDEVVVSRSRSRFNGHFRDFARDTNGDGMFDELVIEVGVHVTDRTALGLRGMLFDRKGTLHDGGHPSEPLEPGERTLELTYPTKFLYEAELAGPLLLDTLRLFEEEEGWIVPLEERTGVYRTSEYSRSDFRYEKIVLNGEVDARGVDTNGNGLFEFLLIEVGVDIDYPGNYAWHALLGSGDDLGAGFVQGNERGPLKKGSNRLRFEFPGACIARMTDKRGYVLESLYVGLLTLGKPPADAPKNAFTGPRIPIRGVPPPGRFEKTGPEVFRSSLGGFYSCSVAARGGR
jgi:hypothetical protein